MNMELVEQDGSGADSSEFIAEFRRKMRESDAALTRGIEVVGARVMVARVGFLVESVGNVIVTSTPERSSKNTRAGRIISLGKRFNKDTGAHDLPMEPLELGDYVLFNSHAGIDVSHIDNAVILQEGEILARVAAEVGTRFEENFAAGKAALANIGHHAAYIGRR